MIRLMSLRVEEFRGIRELELDLGGESFVVLGPNGSGKSAVVDAIDFALTGSVGRLSGKGTGEVTLAKHGPHVHRKDDPMAAKVSLTLLHPASGQVAVLARCLKTPTRYELEPSTPELVAAVEWASQHPELVLSRRQVSRYVNAEPGKRTQEVQALLKLDRIDKTRRVLRSALTQVSKEVKRAAQDEANAADAFRRHLDLEKVLPAEIVPVVNKHRAVLGLDLLESVALDTDLSAGVARAHEAAGFDKASALRDVEALCGYVEGHAELSAAVGEVRAVLSEVEADPSILDSLKRRDLTEAGLPLVEDAACPLCEQAWQSPEELRSHLKASLARSAAAAELQERAMRAAERVGGELRRLRALIQAAQPHAVAVGHGAHQAALMSWSNDLAALEASLGSLDSICAQATLRTDPLPEGISATLTELRSTVEALSDQSVPSDARVVLTIAQERWERFRQARAARAEAAATKKIARAAYETYNDVAGQALSALYKAVADDFSDYYRRLNLDDEPAFKAGLLQDGGKLDLEVDFHGTGMSAPIAYHSEGHQDGMGLCLYLALIDRLLGGDFHFAVLDDVVTSIDTDHRHQFCKLLRDAFPDVQFVITTHDEAWAQQMQSSGLIDQRSLARFHGWSVEGGPLLAKAESSGADRSALSRAEA
jgi:hypothetical protein